MAPEDGELQVASNPAITVVIPTRDRSSLVCRALLSVARQTYAAAEVIVVDDGSRTTRSPRSSASASPSASSTVGDGAPPRLATRESRRRTPSGSRSSTRTTSGARITSSACAARSRRRSGAAALYFSDAALPDGASAFGRSGFAPQAPLERVEHGDRWALLPVQPMMTPASVVSRAAYLACGGQDPALPCREDTHLFLLLGLGGGTCAVAARTVTVTDDARGARLTEQLPGSDAVYWIATARLYEDVLRRFPTLAPSQARELRRRLATAHWRLGRLAWRRRRRGEAAGSAWLSARNDPSVILGRLARRR